MVVTRFMLLTFCFRSIFIIIIIFIKLFLRNDAFGAMLVVFFVLVLRLLNLFAGRNLSMFLVY